MIDVADLLILQGNTLRWHHPGSGAAVGRHSGANQPTTISTGSNGVTLMSNVTWTPTWSSPPPNEIRFDAYSSIYSNLTPALAWGSVAVQATVLSGRGSVSINQFPSTTNKLCTDSQIRRWRERRGISDRKDHRHNRSHLDRAAQFIRTGSLVAR